MAETKTVLHVLYSGLGGHGNVFFSLVNASKQGGFTYEALFYGVEDVRSEYISKCEAAGIKWQFVKKGRKLDIDYYLQIARIIQRSNASVIFLHSGTLVVSAKLANLWAGKRKKILVRETQANHLKTKWEWLYLKLSLKLADAVVFLTESYALEVKQVYPDLMKKNNKKISIISNGLDTNKFIPSTSGPSTQLIFGMQSRLVNIKDYRTLIQAFAAYLNISGVPPSQLKIAGSGPDKEALEALAVSLNVQSDIQFAGLLNEDELIRFLQATDIYIHATLGETMSTAIMQAMACGLPIIASDVKGVNNMITDGEDGLLVPPKNVTALTQKMHLLANNHALAKTLAGSARRKAEIHYADAVMFTKYENILQKLCNK